MWGGKEEWRSLSKDKEKLMLLNRHYLNELSQKIYLEYRPEEYHLRGTKGIKGGVYFFVGMFIVDNELTPLVKIGSTGNIFKRKKQYYTHNPSDLYLIYFYKAFDKKERVETERYYREKFKECRLRDNREWFHLKSVVEELGLDWKRMNEEQ